VIKDSEDLDHPVYESLSVQGCDIMVVYHRILRRAFTLQFTSSRALGVALFWFQISTRLHYIFIGVGL
jgi:hypothetical protein